MRGRSHSRYPSFAMFLAGVVFVSLAPVFWLTTELPEGAHLPVARGNAALYDEAYPALAYGFGRLRAGELPLWDPNQFCGVPFLADPGHGVFAPLNLVFLFLPTAKAMAVHAFLGLFLLAMTLTFFARALETRLLPAMLGGAVLAFSGASAAVMSHPAALNTLAWYPLVLWGLREHVRARRTAPAMVAGLAAGFMLLGGAPALAGVLLVQGACYYAWCLVRPGDLPAGFWRRLRGGLLVFLVAAGVSAVQWAPALAWYAALADPRAALLDFVVSGEAPRGLPGLRIALSAARQAGLPALAAVGALGLAFAPASLLNRRGWFDAVFFFAFAVAGFYVLAGSAAWWGTAPAGALAAYPAAVSLAVLAALGADRVLATGREAGALRHWLSLLLFVGAVAALALFGGETTRGAALVAFVLVLPCGLLRMRWCGRLAGCALLALAFVELNMASANRYQHPFENAPACFTTHAGALATAQDQALGGRVVLSSRAGDTGLTPNLGRITGIPCAGGAHTPLPAADAAWWDALRGELPAGSVAPDAERPALLNYMAARVVLAGAESPLREGRFEADGLALRPLRSVEGAAIHANDSALSRAYWVPGWRTAPDVDAALSLLTGEGFDPREECVVAPGGRAFDTLAAMIPDAATTREQVVDWESLSCEIEEDAPERVAVRVTAAQPGVTVLADRFSPGWRATLDGRATPILRTNGIFRGIATPAGAHTIVFTYRPWPVIAGAALSVLSLGVLTLAALAGLARG